MKRLKSRFSRKGKTVLAVSILGVAALATGGTIAYSQSHWSSDGKFQLFSYRTLFTETFDSPSNWITCQTIDKAITVTNQYEEAVAVRIQLEEQWLASDGVTELPLNSATSGLTMAQINFTQNSGWTRRGRYYYYDTDLAKNATTSSLMTGVTLNCDANLDTQDPTADGAYSDATYHLKITAQTIEAEGKDTWSNTIADMIGRKSNDPNAYTIDFTRKAYIDDSPNAANGNGVNEFTEKGQTVYYYRGEVYDNNVIWANKCWKMLRTTYTGGVKMVYNGEPSDVEVDGETVKQCLATGASTQINGSTNYNFNNDYYSPADSGYMHGTRIEKVRFYPYSTTFTFSNDVSRSGNTYTLDTSAGQSITGTWQEQRYNSATRYHYFCTDGTAVCDNTKIGYVTSYNDASSIYYLPIGGYDNIEGAKAAMFTNTADSFAKATIEAWFESENLDGHVSGSKNYENDLEDAIFCNDRNYGTGSLSGKDGDATPNAYSITYTSKNAAYLRLDVYNAQNNYTPSLDCIKRDAFTKTETSSTNGKLSHKVGLITADEVVLAGANPGWIDDNYLYINVDSWTMTPHSFRNADAAAYYYGDKMMSEYLGKVAGFRPVVSLKEGIEFASGTGLKTDPFIVE